MKILYECSIIFILLPLVACSPAVSTQPASAPQSAVTEIPSLTPAPTCTPTTAILTVDQKVEAYLNGEIDDVGDLNAEDLSKFSRNIVETLSLQRGANPNIFRNEAYLSPDTLKMIKVEDGTTAEQQTIEMFVPISKDAKGNLMYKGPDGEWVIVENSTGFDWNMVVTNSDDPRIELPNYITSEGKNGAAVLLDEINPSTGENNLDLIPMLVWNKTLGQMYFEGVNGHGPTKTNVLPLLKIETDQAGHPIYGRLIIGIQTTSRIYTEGDDSVIGSSGPIKEQDPLWSVLQTDQIYYFMVDVNQQNSFDNRLFISLNNWTNFVSPTTSFDVLTGENINNNDLLLVKFSNLITKN